MRALKAVPEVPSDAFNEELMGEETEAAPTTFPLPILAVSRPGDV
jgi:hypothetical protein